MKWRRAFPKSQAFFIVILVVFVLGAFYFSSRQENITGLATRDSFVGLKLVTKIIDGDTIIVEGESVRLLGIDADEKTYPCYEAAKRRLEELVLNKEVNLEKDVVDKDQYGRYLRYVFLGVENINLRIVKEGLAIARFSPENVKYKEEIIAAEKEAREASIGCKWGNINVSETQISSKNSEWKRLTSNLTGLEVIGSCNAGNYIDSEKIVEGYVAGGFRSKTNTVFLNFDKPYPNQCFTAVIFSSDLYKFPENADRFYEGKLIRIRGIIKEYQGKPEIVLEDLSQIEVGG